MKKVDKLQKIVDEKKAKSENTKPKYGMRKLTVGLVPVFLGALIAFPGSVQAEEVSASTTHRQLKFVRMHLPARKMRVTRINT